MRPRFRILWLLIGLALLSVILCVIFVLVAYPTNKADHFVAGVNDGSINLQRELQLRTLHVPMMELATKVSAELLPRT